MIKKKTYLNKKFCRDVCELLQNHTKEEMVMDIARQTTDEAHSYNQSQPNWLPVGEVRRKWSCIWEGVKY